MMGSFMCKLFSQKEVRFIFLGLDAVGKTTMLYHMKLGEVVTTIPTIGFNVETLQFKGVKMTAWDVGSRDKMRPLWRHYYQYTDGVVFMVDSNDRERINEVKEELYRILDEDLLAEAAICIIANKMDLEDAMTEEEIAEKLEVHKIRHQYAIFRTSALKGEGMYEAMDWLASSILKNQGVSAVESARQTSIEYIKNTVFSFASYFSFKKTEITEGEPVPVTQDVDKEAEATTLPAEQVAKTIISS